MGSLLQECPDRLPEWWLHIRNTARCLGKRYSNPPYDLPPKVLRSPRDKPMNSTHINKSETADLIVAEMKRGNGIISHQDLIDYEAVWREPIIGNYKNYTIISMPPPSSGGIALLALLQSV